MKHSDDWIADRIRRSATKHGVPRGRTTFLDESDAEVVAAINQAASPKGGGVIVLACSDSSARWTALGTRKVLGCNTAGMLDASYSGIHNITSRDYPPRVWRDREWEEPGKLKRSWEYLTVTCDDGWTRDFWVAAGPEAFAFWNILLMLARLEAK